MYTDNPKYANGFQSPLSMVGDKRPGVPRRKPIKRRVSWKETLRGLASGNDEEPATSPVKLRHSSSVLKTPRSRRSTFIGPSDDQGAMADAESEEEPEEDFNNWKEEDRPIRARVRYVPHQAKLVPRSESAVEKQQQELSVAVAEANTKAVLVVNGIGAGGKGNRREPIGTRLTMTSRTGYFQDRVITPSMVGQACLILIFGLLIV